MTGFQVRIIIPTLGDFANGLPAYDGLARQHGPFPMILPNAMRMFNGIKDFVSYQGFVSAVLFEDEVKDCSGILSVHELPAGMFKMKYGGRIEGFARPFVTCHVESFLKEHLKLDFDVSDSYSLKVKDVDVDPGDHIWAGDRWPETLDHRRAHSFMSHLPGLTFLDYKQSIFHNLNIIRKSEYPFVSTFTGVSILADLINKPNVVLWDEDMRNWQGWSPEFSYRRHYFADRNSYIEYIDDFRATELTNARTAERSLSSVKEGKASTIPTSIVTGQSASPGYKECRKDKPLTGDLAIISEADSQFFDLLQGMLRSLQDNAQSYNFTLYIFDLGLTETQRKWLLLQGASLHLPQDALWREGFPVYMHAFLSRSRIPELFPGHEVYLWLDADAWIQRQDAVDAYVEGALRTGFAITPEIDPAYGDDEVLRAHYNSFDMFGDEHLKGFIANGAMNVGVIAGRPDAPHWRAWRRMIETNIQKTDVVSLLFLLDQTALCIVCLRSDLTTALLPATCNWISHFAHPMTSGDGAVLLRPSPSYEELGIIHQTYDTKRIFLPLRRLGGGVLSRTLAYQANSQLAPDEYVSAGLSVILADQCFPHMMRGDQSLSTWNYLRRGLPHAWLVDRRIPEWGFLNRDEAHILYNLALGFSKIRALQIGCFLGWSTCHLAMAGPAIDVIDPLLADPGVLANVQSSLRAGRVLSRVNLIPGRSPSAVHKLAEEHPDGYSLFFIDGDHEGDAPLNDVKACEPYAARDCAMLFHFLVSPHVTNAVLYLKERGWRIRVYHTAQIMAVAWRGNVSPIVHWPDPRIEWLIPTHVIPLLN